MSDDDGDGGWTANQGSTLPGAGDATHNIGLSPIFLTRSGIGNYDDENPELSVVNLGSHGILWSNVARRSASYPIRAYFLQMYSDNIYPSGRGARTPGFSLRCLVSTTSS